MRSWSSHAASCASDSPRSSTSRCTPSPSTAASRWSLLSSCGCSRRASWGRSCAPTRRPSSPSCCDSWRSSISGRRLPPVPTACPSCPPSAGWLHMDGGSGTAGASASCCHPKPIWFTGESAKRFVGVVRAPQRRGVGGKGALVTGQSQEARLKTLMMTHHLRRKAAQKLFFFPKKVRHDTYLKMISASWGSV